MGQVCSGRCLNICNSSRPGTPRQEAGLTPGGVMPGSVPRVLSGFCTAVAAATPCGLFTHQKIECQINYNFTAGRGALVSQRGHLLHALVDQKGEDTCSGYTWRIQVLGQQAFLGLFLLHHS